MAHAQYPEGDVGQPLRPRLNKFTPDGRFRRPYWAHQYRNLAPRMLQAAPCGSRKQAGSNSAPAPVDFRNLLQLAMAISRMRTGLQQARLPACAGCSIIVDGCIYRQISSASIIPMSPTPTLYAAFSPASYTKHTIRYDTVQHRTMSIQYGTTL